MATATGSGRCRPPAHDAANRVEYRRPGGVVEWYINGPLGLEQGFDLAAPPVGGGPAAAR